MRLYWRGITRHHDWYDEGRTIPRRMLAQARRAGLVGTADWVAVGPDDERKSVGRDEETVDRLLDHRPERGELFSIAAGGSEPSPWEMTLGLFPFDASEGEVRGYNILNLWFEDGPWVGPERSDALAQTFRAVHTPDDTEAAFIHPYVRWSELSDPLRGPYGSPVTYEPFFSGVYWANFLGRAHLALFDLARLREMRSHQVEWTGDDGLFVRVCRDVADAADPAVEEEMLRLTGLFRAARRA